jgi:hypothetical protein
MQSPDHSEPSFPHLGAAQHIAAVFDAPAPHRRPWHVARAGLAGLIGSAALLALAGSGWLLLGAVTDVWVDGCPDIAPPLAPALWRWCFLYGLAPLLVGLCLRAGWRMGRRLEAGPAVVGARRGDVPKR